MTDDEKATAVVTAWAERYFTLANSSVGYEDATQFVAFDPDGSCFLVYKDGSVARKGNAYSIASALAHCAAGIWREVSYSEVEAFEARFTRRPTR